MSIDNRMAAYAYYGITTPEDARAANELESEGRMPATKRTYRLLQEEVDSLKTENERLRAALEKIYKQANRLNIIILARDALFGGGQPDTPGQRED